jgi:hypothetical protein
VANLPEIDDAERRVRASVHYPSWVERNMHARCLLCDSGSDLVVHHIIDLRTALRCLFALYGDWDNVVKHASAMHADDTCEGVTLCRKCHDGVHSGRRPRPPPKASASNSNWTAAPRNLWSPFRTGTRSRGHGLGLAAFQTLLGMGWHILGGQVDPESRMVEFHKRRFADLLGREPGTSFNASLEGALASLTAEEYILGSAIIGNDVEVHLAPRYVDALLECPWFFPLEWIGASSMTTLALSWHLSHQGGRRSYMIGVDKLAERIGLSSLPHHRIVSSVTKSCGGLEWAKVSLRGEVFEFRLSETGSVPIHSLRSMLADSLRP